ncbi:MAG TPA: hypothetical protein VJQ45_08655 [Ktedonobacterales bacterium]|nr:hypothetical protein [Ktedonobacterales bacterium]
MRGAHRIGIAVVTAALTMGSGAGRASAPPKQSADPPVDQGLLEFLGSVDPPADATQPDDGSWLAYLAQIDIGKEAKAAQAPQAPAQAKPAHSPPGGEKPNG